ncbi:MAG: peptidylprolyl isomerase [Victivallales bacterium]|nr:peptidylprolyl isomerase [Victivallales bacterium]
MNSTRILLCTFLIIASVCLWGDEQKVSPHTMAVLQDGDTALRMYGENLSWVELKRLMERDNLSFQKDKEDKNKESQINRYLQRMARMAAALHLTQEKKVELSDGERAKYLEMMRKELENNKQWKSFEDFVKRYPAETKSIFDPSLLDVLRMAKFNDLLTTGLDVSDNEIIEYENQIKAGQLAVEQFNKVQRRLLDEALAKGEVDTDEKFAEFARQHSEGKEAENGGLLGEFPRWVVASACELDEFEYKAGETSKVIVTKQAFRLMRVLSVKPPKKEGEDELIKVAQILLMRYSEEKLEDRDVTREKLLRQKQMDTLKNVFMAEISKSGLVCPLFPRGLFTVSKEEEQ